MIAQRQYYCLIAGLPDISMNENKAALSVIELRENLKSELHPDDYRLVQTLFYPFDHHNILKAIYKLPDLFDDNGNFSIDEISSLTDKTKFDEPLPENVPIYLGSTIREALSQDALMPAFELSTLLMNGYIDYCMMVNNSFLTTYTTFDTNIRNLLTALNGRQYQMDVEQQLIGNNEIAEALRKNKSRDFGISLNFDQLEIYLQLFDSEDILTRELKLDTLRWHFVDESIFFHFFTVERILGYLIQLQIKERWQKLDPTAGLERFNSHLDNLLQNCEYPNQFNISHGRKQ